MTALLSGTFTTEATPVAFNLPLPSGYDYFEMWNVTDLNTANLTSATTQVMRARAFSQMPPGSLYYSAKTSGSAQLQLETFALANGFTFFSNANPPVFALIAVTAVTAASPAQVTAAAHGLVVGDSVRLTQLNGTMQSMSGLVFTVNSVVDANNFTITFDATGAAIGGTPATAGFMQKIVSSYWSPHNVVIGPSPITLAAAGNSIVLDMNSVPSRAQAPSQYIPFQRPYQVGAILRLYLPSGFGTLTSANFLLVQIQSINTKAGYAVANELYCSILPGNPIGSPTTAVGLGALIYPAGAAGYSGQVPMITDIAEVVQDLSEAEDNTGIFGITIGTQAQALSTTGGATTGVKTWQWFARQGFVQPLFIS